MLSCPLCQYSCYKSMYLVNIWIQKRWVNQGSKCWRKLKWVAVSPCSFPFPLLQLQLQLSWSPRFNFIYAHTEIQLARMYLLQVFFWRVETNYFDFHSHHHSLTCHFHFSASFSQKNWTPVCFFFWQKGISCSFSKCNARSHFCSNFCPSIVINY